VEDVIGPSAGDGQVGVVTAGAVGDGGTCIVEDVQWSKQNGFIQIAVAGYGIRNELAIHVRREEAFQGGRPEVLEVGKVVERDVRRRDLGEYSGLPTCIRL
jgi:hypothetical protein